MAEPILGPLSLPHFLVKQLKPERHGITEADLATSIQEIEIQTQILGASFLKVHVIDPEWKVITSGLVKVDEDGFLNELEVEFPEGTGYFWRLAAIEGNRDFSQAQLLMTFEDRVVARLRKRWGHLTAAAGTTTRAQFVRQLVNECNLKEHGKFPPIKFVCPGVSRVEPVEESTEQKEVKTGITKTKRGKAKANAVANKERGIHSGHELTVGGAPMTSVQRDTANELLKVANEVAAGPTPTEALIYAAIGETKLGGEQTTSSAGAKGTLQSLHAPFDTPSQAKNFLKGSQDFQKEGAIKLSRTVSDPKQIAVEVEVPSVWPTNAYATQSGGQNYLLEAQQIIAAGGGVRGGGTSQPALNEADVGQLSRGTTQNPDENSFQCMERLANQVNWRLFTDGRNTLFYMDGPDLLRQRPVLYVNPTFKLSNGDITDHIVREDKGGQRVDEYGQIINPFSFTYDNVSLEYRATHKIKGRTQRKAALAKPSTPAEIRLLLNCGLTEYRAGDVFVFRHCGPISENSGRWIIQDATRETMRYPYTKFILVPPPEPLPEPKATQSPTPTGTSEGGSGSALAAFNAASELSSLELNYVLGGSHGPGGLAAVKRGSVVDCSSSTSWVLWKAGLFQSTTAEVSGELAASFGEAGKGKEMTVWANANHVFIEFNIPGHERAQWNTNGSLGPRLYTLSKNPTYNPSPETESFTARHAKGL